MPSQFEQGLSYENEGKLDLAEQCYRQAIELSPESPDAHAHLDPGEVPFEAKLDVTEPMGMETLVYFPLNGTQVCGRVNPNAGARDGGSLKLAANLNNMHLIDEVSGQVI